MPLDEAVDLIRSAAITPLACRLTATPVRVRTSKTHVVGVSCGPPSSSKQAMRAMGTIAYGLGEPIGFTEKHQRRAPGAGVGVEWTTTAHQLQQHTNSTPKLSTQHTPPHPHAHSRTHARTRARMAGRHVPFSYPRQQQNTYYPKSPLLDL
jgi:hypothetical protein